MFHPARAFSFKTTCYGVYLLLWVLAIRMANQRASNKGLLSRFIGMLTDSRCFNVVSAARIFSPCFL